MLLAILLIPSICVALAVLIDSGWPAFFCSQRTGVNGRPFIMPKFRSMYQNAPLTPTPHFYDASKFTTRLGGWLRKNSLDELPQLWSVIRGDMSLVGPRPMLYKGENAIHALRKKYALESIKPGITGWAQINGRDKISMVSKVQLDCEYALRRSFLFDCKIILLTIKNICMQKPH